MSKKRSLVLLLLTAVLLLSGCGDAPLYEPGVPVENIPFEILGTQLTERYPAGDVARCPWDMILFDGKLYLGSGDYDLNAGPAEIWSYDPETKVLAQSGIVPDEEVNRFCFLYGELATPGIDPTEDWELGNYYVLRDGIWQKNRVIPGGIHTFDIVEFNGMLFAGLGVLRGEYPISFSLDGGESFESVPMWKNEKRLKTDESDTVRAYDLFLYEDALYATFSYGSGVYELYRYDEDQMRFDFLSDWSGKVTRIKYKYMRIAEKVVFDGTMFFTTGYLYRTTDMIHPEKLPMPEGTVVCDICVYEDALYLLCGKKTEDGTFKTTVMKTTSAQSDTFETLFDFKFDAPPMSFAIDGDHCYIGMGSGTSKNEKNGTLLRVNYPLFRQ